MELIFLAIAFVVLAECFVAACFPINGCLVEVVGGQDDGKQGLVVSSLLGFILAVQDRPGSVQRLYRWNVRIIQR